MNDGHDTFAEWDAAYVLGALSPTERREFERHLSGCDACRAAVAELAGMPAVLSELSVAQAASLVAPPTTADRAGGADVVPIAALASTARRDRRRRRVWQTAAAVALVGAGVAGGVALAPSEAPETDDATVLALSPVDGSAVSADVSLSTSPWGTRMEWSCDYPDGAGYGGGSSGTPAPSVYELVLVESDGTRTVVGTWTGGDTHPSGLLASSAIALDDIARVELAVGDGTVLAAADLSTA